EQLSDVAKGVLICCTGAFTLHQGINATAHLGEDFTGGVASRFQRERIAWSQDYSPFLLRDGARVADNPRLVAGEADAAAQLSNVPVPVNAHYHQHRQ